MNTQCGIYLIENTVNGKAYVGSSITISERWAEHRRCLERGDRGNTHLRAAWKKYGPSVFVCRTLEYCAEEDLIEREGWWIALLDSMNPRKGYNKAYADRHAVTEEQRARISATLTGRKLPREVVERIRQANRGKTRSQEWRDSMSQRFKGVPPSEAAIKASIAANTGHQQSTETVEKRVSHMRGKPLSPEHRQKVSHGMKGKPKSSEHRESIRQANLGKTLSPEHRTRLAEAARRHWIERKAKRND